MAKCPICDGMGTSNTCVNGTFKPCTFCDGTGEVMTDDIKIRCDDCKFQENCVDYGWQRCRKFTPKPSESMTNEEYLKSLDTEQLAEFLYDIAYFDNWSDAIMNDSLINETAVEDAIEKWLKQPHIQED